MNTRKKVEGPLTDPFKLEETPIGTETVPEGELFVMGDNRRFSKDSRHIGTVAIGQSHRKHKHCILANKRCTIVK